MYLSNCRALLQARYLFLSTSRWSLLQALHITALISISAGTARADTPTPDLATDKTHAVDVRMHLLRVEGDPAPPRRRGLTRLAWEVRKRTSVDIDLQVTDISPQSKELYQAPFLVWQGEKSFLPWSKESIYALRQVLRMGATLWIDLSDGDPKGDFYRSVLATLARVFPDQSPKAISKNHVVYRSFYALRQHGGRVPTWAHLEGIEIEDRFAVIISANDIAGAMATDSYGRWLYPVASGGDAAREMSMRLGINLLMYALCLDYKEDQVHIRHMLERRR